MAPINPSSGAHHHRSTTKVSNKAFKTRHASKSALKDQAKGKVESFEKGSRKTLHQQVMSKFDRKNHAKQIRSNKLAERAKQESVFTGRDGAPRIVAVIPLCEDVRSGDVIRELNSSVEVEAESPGTAAPSWRVEIPRFKQKVQYLTPQRDLLECLDACRVSDFVLFLLSATEEVDELGEQTLRCVESQGVSTVLTAVHNLSVVEPAKKRPDVVKSLKSFINHFFATQEKLHDISSRQDCSNVMRSLCTTMPKGVRWREDRSWMLVDEVRWEDGAAQVTGVVRGKGLKADRLVQVGEWGDFQIESTTAAPLESKKRGQKADAMVVDLPQFGDVLEAPTEQQDDLAELAPEEMMEDLPAASLAPSERKAVMLDDHEYFDDDDRGQFEAPKRLPRGTSKYQAAWYLGDVSDSGSDLEDIDADDEELPNGSIAAGSAEGRFDATMAEPTEGAPSEYPQTEAFDDPDIEDEAEQLAAYRRQRQEDANDDLEFPDEIELHPHAQARERLARYRGLKSLRASTWDTEEDKPYEPEDWSRLLEIADYKSAKNRVLKEALYGGVKPGTRVTVHLRVRSDQAAALKALPVPKALFSLLKHEHKQTAVNMSMSLSSEYERPLKSKEELILQCGPRRLVINPLFSQAGNTPNNVHKFDRFLHPGRTAVASFIGPVVWGSVPCLYFKRPDPAQPQDAVEDLAQDLAAQDGASKPGELQLIATGTSLPPSTQRVIAKRIILTGHPFKIHRKLVTVRYMFFNTEDVQYFRALQLWTKRGRSGFIKEPLGTHGYFKATFDGTINPMDAVAVSLYKRVWPRSARPWKPELEQRIDEVGEDAVAMVE
ncbi:ribosome biogenesis protein tsr1 [Saxophila tyrrhenica]|uniref:Ribosome biogenesis protein tsr1 n=1 Tax=Saxophila tyrrhenica TaxID=1690608 RepID=A0AAV9PNY8_9PEZI|nr:ribosome biogenesis protein tsr1 [Saxophila tyrrhenica]